MVPNPFLKSDNLPNPPFRTKHKKRIRNPNSIYKHIPVKLKVEYTVRDRRQRLDWTCNKHLCGKKKGKAKLRRRIGCEFHGRNRLRRPATASFFGFRIQRPSSMVGATVDGDIEVVNGESQSVETMIQF